MQNQFITQKGYRNATNVSNPKQRNPVTKSQDNFRSHGKAPNHIPKGEMVLHVPVAEQNACLGFESTGPCLDCFSITNFACSRCIDAYNFWPLEVGIIAPFEGDYEQRRLSPNAAIGCVARCLFLLSGYFHMHS